MGLSTGNDVGGIPRRTLILGGGAAGVILIFLLGVILPGHLSIKKMEKNLKALKTELKGQQLLQPVYRAMADQSQNMPDKGGLVLSERKPVKRAEIGKLSGLFSHMALKSGVTLDRCVPDVNFMGASRRLIRVDLEITGEYAKLRDFLVRLGALPSLERVDLIKITAGTVSESCFVKFLLAMEK